MIIREHSLIDVCQNSVLVRQIGLEPPKIVSKMVFAISHKMRVLVGMYYIHRVKALVVIALYTSPNPTPSSRLSQRVHIT